VDVSRQSRACVGFMGDAQRGGGPDLFGPIRRGAACSAWHGAVGLAGVPAAREQMREAAGWRPKDSVWFQRFVQAEGTGTRNHLIL